MIVNLYEEQLGKHNFVECIVRAAVYFGLIAVVPVVLVPHLWVKVHAISRGNLSVITLISAFVPVVHDVVVGDGFNGLNVGREVGMEAVGLSVLVGWNVGWVELVALDVG